MSKVKELPALSEAQLEIMNVVWANREVTVGQVWKAVSTHRNVARNTILTLMERLEKKGWLKRKSDGHLYRYSAVASRDATLRQVVRRLVDTAFNGSPDGLLMALLDGRGVTKDEAERIRKMIDKAKRRRS